MLESGRALGLFFEDAEAGAYPARLALVLEPSGGCMSYCGADGLVRREMTCFAHSGVRKQVLQVLAFRNRLSDTPFVHPALHTSDVDLDHRVAALRWPTDAAGVEELEDGRRCVYSLEGAAVLTLAQNRLSFRVEVLVPLAQQQSPETFQYTRVTQTFFCDAPPRRYKEALRLALGKSSSSQLAYTSEDLPRSPAVVEPSWDESASVQGLLLALVAGGPAAAQPPGDTVCFDWTPAATYRLVRNGVREVRAGIAADQSVLVVRENGYAEHTRPRSPGRPRVYAPEGVPRVIQLDVDKDYELAPVYEHARRILAQASPGALVPGAPTGALTGAPPVARLRVLEEEHVPDLGRFTYLSDGSVKAVFSDRTILFSDSGFQTCEVVSGEDGTCDVVSCQKPCGKARYVRWAAAFCRWASTSPSLRPSHFEHPDKARSRRLQAALRAAERQLLCNQTALAQLSMAGSDFGPAPPTRPRSLVGWWPSIDPLEPEEGRVGKPDAAEC